MRRILINTIISAVLILLTVLISVGQKKIEALDLAKAPYLINGIANNFILDNNGDPIIFSISQVPSISSDFYLNLINGGQRINKKIDTPISGLSKYYPDAELVCDDLGNIMIYSTNKDLSNWNEYSVVTKNLDLIFYSKYGGEKLSSVRSKYPNCKFLTPNLYAHFPFVNKNSKGLIGPEVIYGTPSTNIVQISADNQYKFDGINISDRIDGIYLNKIKNAIYAKDEIIWASYSPYANKQYIVKYDLRTQKNEIYKMQELLYSDTPILLYEGIDNSILVWTGYDMKLYKIQNKRVEFIGKVLGSSYKNIVGNIIDENGVFWCFDLISKKIFSINTTKDNLKIEIDISNTITSKVFAANYDYKKKIFWILISGNVLHKIQL